MIHRVRGIVLHHVRYRESSAIINIYTDLFGRQAYLVNSIKGKGSRYRSNLLQPLTLLEMEVYHKLGRELQRVKDIRNYIPYRSIPFNPFKSSQAMFLAEVLFRSIREEDPTPGLFEFLEYSLQILDMSEDNIMNFHLFFLVQLTKYLGFYPENNFNQKNFGFDMRDGQFVDSLNLHPDFFDSDSSLLLHELLGTTFNDRLELSINKDVRIRFLEYMMDYYRLHLQGFGRIKSLSVLREIFR
jgi:DNA repair protein RecO (recombination protein O)